MKQNVKELLVEYGRVLARELADRLRLHRGVDYYGAMERLLRGYKRLRRTMEALEDYGFEPVERSHDVKTSPPIRGGTADRLDLYEDFVEARRLSYVRSRARFEEIDAVIRQFADRPEFLVIRMYYFGEDSEGNDRVGRPYTFDEIADELAARGLDVSVYTLRSWRTRLVQEMTVVMFGADGAVGIELSDPRRSRTEEKEEKDEQ